MKETPLTWAEFKVQAYDLHSGTEHVVDLSEDGVVVKITIPPGFGLTPAVVSHPVVNLRNEPSSPAERQTIEFFQTLAIDALPRNCYINDGSLLPFDVILCRPNDPLEKFLGLYPD